MPELWLFLVEVFTRFGLAINVDAWYFGVVNLIRFVPQAVVDLILTENGHSPEDACGVAMMTYTDASELIRTMKAIYLVEPGSIGAGANCTVENLRFSIEHELRHVYEWLVNGVPVWAGH